MPAIGPPPAAIPAWIDLTRYQRGEVRIMTSAIAYIRPRPGHTSNTTVTLVDGSDIRVTESYSFVCALLEGRDPNEPPPPTTVA